ncbi:hypothetical protein HDU97_004805 [Phlyctochytrium planicorne]|nr:hypothetical protein HDU97_004805 [Phlyctochytrium planicorne]
MSDDVGGTPVMSASAPNMIETETSEMPKKQYHMFISYRVRTDADTAERLCDKLQGCSILREQKDFRLKCFLDKQNLTEGQDFKTQFLEGLNGSCLFLPIISMGVLAGMAYLSEESEDNVLLEWETALELFEQGHIAIFPILVGEVEVVNERNLYRRFDSFGMIRDIPDVHIKGSVSKYTARQAIDALFKLQGVFMNPMDLPDKLNAIVERFSVDIWPKFREHWADQESIGAEPLQTCVQCLNDFRASDNGEGACRFHRTGDKMYYGNETTYKCCQKDDAGCSRSKHRSKHHCDYPYSEFNEWSSAIVNYTDASQILGEVSAFDYSMDRSTEVICVTVGRVLNKTSDRNKLYIRVWTSDRRWFYTLSHDELELVDHKGHFFKLDHVKGYGAEIKWIQVNGEVEGVEFSCYSKTSSTPSTCLLQFAWPEIPDDNGPRATKVEYTNDPIFGELPLLEGSTYDLPKGRYHEGQILKYPIGRQADKSLPVWSQPGCPLRCKLLDSKPRHQAMSDRDLLDSTISILNPTSSDITIVECRAFARLRVDESNLSKFDEGNDGLDEEPIKLSPHRWIKLPKIKCETVSDAPPPQPQQPVFQPPPFRPMQIGGRPPQFAPPPIVFRQPVPERQGGELPATVPANGNLKVDIIAFIDTSAYKGREVSYGFLDFSWIAFVTNAPVVIDLEFEDIFGKVFGIMIEYPVPKLKINGPNPEDLVFLFNDDPEKYSRFQFRVTPPPPPPAREDFTGSDPAYLSSLTVLKVNKEITSGQVDVMMLRRTVWRALEQNKTGVSTGECIDMSDMLLNDGNRFDIKIFGMVDLPRKSVYALKIVVTLKDNNEDNKILGKSLAYVSVPPYGDALREDKSCALTSTPATQLDPIPSTMIDIEDVIEASKGQKQSMAPILPRLDFSDTKKEETPGATSSSVPAAAVGPSIDTEALIKSIQTAVRSEVEDAVRAAMQVQMARMKEEIKVIVRDTFSEEFEKVKEELVAANTDVAPPSVVEKVEEGANRGGAEMDKLVSQFAEIVRTEGQRIEATITATATAAAAVSIRQQQQQQQLGRGSSDGAGGIPQSGKKKGFWNL